MVGSDPHSWLGVLLLGLLAPQMSSFVAKVQWFQVQDYGATDAIEFQHRAEARGRDPVVGGRRGAFRGGPQGPGVGVAEDVAGALADADRQGRTPHEIHAAMVSCCGVTSIKPGDHEIFRGDL